MQAAEPEHPPETLSARVRSIFAPEGPLRRAVSGFESRAAQRQMADAVAEAIESNEVLLVEAGTGTGKTLAYLIPALVSGRRVLVSTGTKNLQEQIVNKDLPVVAQTIGDSFTATVMKGRGNYLCLHRLQAMGMSHDFTVAIEEGATIVRIGTAIFGERPPAGGTETV